MKIKDFENEYGPNRQREVIERVNQDFNLGLPEINLGPIKFRPMFSYGGIGYDEKTERYSTFICDPNMIVDENRRAVCDLSLKERLQIELTLLHETGHIIHIYTNPFLNLEWNVLLEKTKKDKNSPRNMRYDRVFGHGEMVAESLAWWNILKEGREREFGEIITKSRGNYYEMYHLVMNTPEQRLKEIMREMLKRDYEEIKGIEELRKTIETIEGESKAVIK